jgi:hypothetical protein
MPILNYTTEVSPEKTAAEIERILANHGARNVNKEYDPKTHDVIGLFFSMPTPSGEISFRLPVRPDQMFVVLKQQLNWTENRYWGQELERVREKRRLQAARVAWRDVKDWIAAQMALIETRQIKVEEAFFAYALVPGTGGKTLFERVTEQKLLTQTTPTDGEFHEVKE